MDFDAGKAYRLLFNTITNAIMKLDTGSPQDARRMLVWGQRIAEEQYITAPERFTKPVTFPAERRNQMNGNRPEQQRQRDVRSKTRQNKEMSLAGKSQDS